MTISKDMMRINNRLLESEEYSPIDVNIFMEGLDNMGRFRFVNKVKTGLAAPLQLWSWMRGNSSGIKTFKKLNKTSIRWHLRIGTVPYGYA